MLRNKALLLFVPAIMWFGVASIVLLRTSTDEETWNTVERHDDAFEGAATCRRCHPDQYRTWYASYHRTMTQSAGEETVTAPFAGEYVDYLGFRTIMDRSADGAYRMSVYSESTNEADQGRSPWELIESYSIVMTIGSHHYQQYVAQVDRGGGPKEAWRLPMVWHHAEQRWLPTNAAFVEPEGEKGSRKDFFRHFSRWNDNCIFCHNTDLSPGLNARQEFQSHVGELGIACEACHGPAESHLTRHQNPARRLLADGRQGDGTMTHPGRLIPARESAICGRCHGQRIGHNIEKIMAKGDEFIPGELLSKVSRPIFSDSQVQGMAPNVFAPRFWPDETPRLSAYEYQGLLLSPCYSENESKSLGCNDCHDMHGSQPNKQIREGRERGRSCQSCHDIKLLSQPPSQGTYRGHGGHEAMVREIDCLDCHMPRITYGLLEGMISHRITSPDPGRWLGRKDQPDACTQCHVDKTRLWARDHMSKLGFSSTKNRNVQEKEENESTWASRVVLDLYGGDALQRNLAADALGYEKATGRVEWKMAMLVDALGDEYPSVRWFAWRSLRALARRSQNTSVLNLIRDFDHLADPVERIPTVQALTEVLPSGPFSGFPERVTHLQQLRDDQVIWIGE